MDEEQMLKGVSIDWKEVTKNGRNVWQLKQGNLQFSSIPKADFDLLEWGDQVREPREKGMTQYVNVCSGCGEKFLHGTLIYVPFYHNGCELKTNELLADLFALQKTHPDEFNEIIDRVMARQKGVR